MGPDDWMLGDNWFSSDSTPLPSRGINLLDSRVSRPQSMKSLLEPRAQSVVRLNLVGKESISSNLWNVKDIQKGCSRRLNLIRDIRVPRYRGSSGLEE
jgi:hypothetical protein